MPFPCHCAGSYAPLPVCCGPSLLNMRIFMALRNSFRWRAQFPRKAATAPTMSSRTPGPLLEVLGGSPLPSAKLLLPAPPHDHVTIGQLFVSSCPTFFSSEGSKGWRLCTQRPLAPFPRSHWPRASHASPPGFRGWTRLNRQECTYWLRLDSPP